MQGYWSRDADALLASLESGRSGLTTPEAERRLAAVGENRVDESERSGVLRLLGRQIASPLVLILLFGAGVSLAVRQWTDALIILMIVAGSAVLGFSQEYRASEAVRRLRERLSLKATVVRDGRRQDVDTRRVVPGDIVELRAGDLVPADGVVIEARDFLVAEAALTGESFPVEKSPGITAADAPLARRSNAVFLGTSVRSGSARVLVVETGARTVLAGIASEISLGNVETAFGRGIRKFGYLLTRIMTVMVLFVLTVNLLQQRPLIDSLLFAVALAVGLTPELLPAIVSVTLSAGARRMAKSGVIVRRLEAIENLGGIDVLCTDKTGTLTKGVVELSAAVDARGRASARVERLATINAGLETGISNPLDAAITEHAHRCGVAIGDVEKIDEIPYDFVRKRLTIVVDDKSRSGVAAADEAGAATGHGPGTHLIVTKGAFEAVLSCCAALAGPDGPVPLDETLRKECAAYCGTRGAAGLRVLAVATRRVPAKVHYDRADEAGMTLEGFIEFTDPLKEDIAASIGGLRGLGVGVKIVSGDNRFVTAHIGAAIGLDPARLLTGRELNEMPDEALRHLAERTEIFAEVDPQQKERVVRALQARGHGVAYLGDGINDAPALNAADVGISVDDAVDVARESADVVLLERNLDVLSEGVVDGRRTYANTLKYVAITTSANFGNMISMALATLFVPFLPLLAKQILLNNFLSDFPSMAISSDNVDAESTETAQRWDIARIQSFMIVFGMISTVFDLATFYVLLHVFQAQEVLFQSAWFVVSLLTELAVVLVLRSHRPAWQSRPSLLLAVSTAAVALVAIALPYIGPVARAFGFVPLPPGLLVASVLIVVAYVGATEMAKQWYFRRWSEGQTGLGGAA